VRKRGRGSWRGEGEGGRGEERRGEERRGEERRGRGGGGGREETRNLC